MSLLREGSRRGWQERHTDWGEPDDDLQDLISSLVPADRTASACLSPLPKSQTHWRLPCHPQTAFSTPKAMQAALNKFAVGYGVVITSSNASRVQFGCDRHLERRTHNTPSGSKSRPNVKTRRSGCGMKVSAKKKADGAWHIIHGTTSTVHNHPPAMTSFASPVLRRATRTEAVCEAIAADAQTGVSTGQTIARMKITNPDAVLTARDVYNERERAVTVALGGLSRIEFLLSVLRGGNYFVRFQVDRFRRLSHLFFADRRAIEIFRENPDVLLMDRTYKTNRFGMPLLNIVGVTGMNTTIHVAQVFLRGETELDFAWAHQQLHALRESNAIALPLVIFTDRDLAMLNSLEMAYPNVPVLLCLWHVIKAVETHARTHTFRKERAPQSTLRTPKYQDSAAHRQFCDTFLRVIRSTSTAEYVAHRAELWRLSPAEALYIDETWLDVWEKQIVRLWTNQTMHFGMQATSRVEGYHATLKSWIRSSKVDLLTIHTRPQHWWSISSDKYWAGVDEATSKVLQRTRGQLYAGVVGVIHCRALTLTADLSKKTHNSSQPCTGVYSHTTGLPCAHRLHAACSLGPPIGPEDFHPHWWIRRSRAAPAARLIILEPDTIRARRAMANEARRITRDVGGGSSGVRRMPSNLKSHSPHRPCRLLDT